MDNRTLLLIGLALIAGCLASEDTVSAGDTLLTLPVALQLPQRETNVNAVAGHRLFAAHQHAAQLGPTFDASVTVPELEKKFYAPTTIPKLGPTFDASVTVPELEKNFYAPTTIPKLGPTFDAPMTVVVETDSDAVNKQEQVEEASDIPKLAAKTLTTKPDLISALLTESGVEEKPCEPSGRRLAPSGLNHDGAELQILSDTPHNSYAHPTKVYPITPSPELSGPLLGGPRLHHNTDLHESKTAMRQRPRSFYPFPMRFVLYSPYRFTHSYFPQ